MHGVVARSARNIKSLESPSNGQRGRGAEECRAYSRTAIRLAHVEELQFRKVRTTRDRSIIDHRHASKRAAFECRLSHASTFKDVEELLKICFGLARLPAWDIKFMRLQDELTVLEPINVCDVL